MTTIETIYNLTAINNKLEAMNKQAQADYNKLKEYCVLLAYSFSVFILAAIVYTAK